MTWPFGDLPEQHFGCILADPPWAFRTLSGSDRTPTQKKAFHQADDHYKTMSLDALKALPVGDLAGKNCALFMWVVGSHLDAALELGRAWGFELKTDAFIWLKERLWDAGQLDLLTGDVPPPGISMGYWTRKQSEACWMFTRGKPRRLSKGVRQVIVAPRREHSRKPDEQYDRIEALVAGPYVELFARTQREGWSNWGNETGKFEVAA